MRSRCSCCRASRRLFFISRSRSQAALCRGQPKPTAESVTDPGQDHEKKEEKKKSGKTSLDPDESKKKNNNTHEKTHKQEGRRNETNKQTNEGRKRHNAVSLSQQLMPTIIVLTDSLAEIGRHHDMLKYGSRAVFSGLAVLLGPNGCVASASRQGFTRRQ